MIHQECEYCGGCHCYECGDPCQEDREEGEFSPKHPIEPADPNQISVGQLPDGAPLLRIGTNVAVALDFDSRWPVLGRDYSKAIAAVMTDRGFHFFFRSLEDAGQDLVQLADPGHLRASLAGGSWDVRVRFKTDGPRKLIRLSVETKAKMALYSHLERLWLQAGGGKSTDVFGLQAGLGSHFLKYEVCMV